MQRFYVDKNNKTNFSLRSHTFNLGFVTLSFTSVFILFLLMFLYVVEVNEKSAKGAKVSELEEKINELEENNKKLKTQIIQKRSLQSFNKEEKNFVSIKKEDIQYLDVVNGFVVMNSKEE